jgi:carbamoyl-phosphate synthase large subunit
MEVFMASGLTITSDGLKSISVLFTCVGRRVSLVQAFQRAAKQLNRACTTVGADANPLSPALYVCDHSAVTPPITDDRYISCLMDLVKKYHINLLVPTIDTELKLLARYKEEFKKAGACVLVSEPEVIALCQDKRKTYRFLLENGFDTPWTKEPAELRADEIQYPVFLKPWNGSASRGSSVVRNIEEFEYNIGRVPNGLVQEYITGQEYTCDAYVDFKGDVRCVVPRKRIEVRGGEVSKSQTCRLPELMDTCRRLVHLLKAGPGVITIQCFVTNENKIKFIEVNPRFGGGAPLSIRSGADFPLWILSELTQKPLKIDFDGWQDSLYMLRYDEAVWIDGSKIVK